MSKHCLEIEKFAPARKFKKEIVTLSCLVQQSRGQWHSAIRF